MQQPRACWQQISPAPHLFPPCPQSFQHFPEMLSSSVYQSAGLAGLVKASMATQAAQSPVFVPAAK